MSRALIGLSDHLQEGQRQLLAAAAAKARGDLNPLELKEGRMPSVQVTLRWIKHLAEKFSDVGEFSCLLLDFAADPASYTAASMAVEDPGGHIFSAVKAAAHGVYKRMGDKELSQPPNPATTLQGAATSQPPSCSAAL